MKIKRFNENNNQLNVGDYIKVVTNFKTQNDEVLKSCYEIFDVYYESDEREDEFGVIEVGHYFDIKDMLDGHEVWEIYEDLLYENSTTISESDVEVYKNEKKFNL